IDTSSANLVSGIPWVETDDKMISKLAYDHLRGCGLRNFAFVGSNFNWSKWRKNHFEEILIKNGKECHFYNMPINLKTNWAETQRDLEAWVATLPKPIGIFTAYDQLGRLIIDMSHKSG